ncbi:MAG: serine/threonine-protein kinase [Myxococcota bacterium]
MTAPLETADTHHSASHDTADTHLSASAHEVKTIPGTSRTTILPRIEWEGEQPKLAPTHRLRFEELEQLGEGGMGEVMLVKDHDIERTVALKRLPPTADLGAVLRFIEEIRAVGQLEHPNIMPVHDVGVDEQGRYFFVMKHLKGETLEKIIERLRAGEAEAHAKYTFTVRAQIMLGVLNAIAYAHRQGFLHRDLKPANIMVGPFGEVTVLDWGLARRMTSKDAATTLKSSRDGVFKTQLGSLMGTPLYMCPEQARGAHDQLDARSDLYSLSVLFHELLYLQHYLAGRENVPEVLDGVKTVAPETVHAPRHPAQPHGVPPELGWYVARGMEKDPAQRFQSAEEMIAALQAILRGEFKVQCAATFTKRMLRESASAVDDRPILAVAVAGLVVLLSISGAVLLAMRLLG